jgi:aminocarboxymuconate-semialdehyde decarboxylase
MKIDSHTHIIPSQLPNWASKFGCDGFIHLEHQANGTANMMKGETFFRNIKSNCWAQQERIDEYAKFNVTQQVVCTIPVLFSYWAKPNDGADIAMFLNDDIAQTVNDFPNHYIGLGTLPMQDAELSIKELHRIKKLGFKGIQIGSNINDLNLNEPQFFPIFEACQELDLAIMVHPWNMMGQDKMQKYWLPWLVGMPAETSRAMCSLIFGGVLEKLPKLRWMFSHAGGEFLFTLGRIEHGYNCRPDLVAKDNPINPRNYLGKFWIDSITHDAKALQYCMDMVGVDKICFGTDYPFPLGDLEMGKFIMNMNLGKEVEEKIFRVNTLEWLGNLAVS